MKERRAPLVSPGLLAMGLGILFLDQLTKYLTVQFFADKPYQSVQIVGDFVRYTFATNRGAAFGMMQGQRWLFVLVGLVVVPAIFYFYRTLSHEPWFVRLSLGLLLGGTLGNFVDRVFTGEVVDFVDVGLGSLRWPTFNVSDSSFVVGTVVVVFYVLFFQGADHRESQPGDATPRG